MVVAICDSDLIGRKLEDQDGKRVLDLSGEFFKGEEKSEEEVKEIIFKGNQEDASFNIVGEESCKVAKEIGLVEDEGIGFIENVPVALVLM